MGDSMVTVWTAVIPQFCSQLEMFLLSLLCLCTCSRIFLFDLLHVCWEHAVSDSYTGNYRMKLKQNSIHLWLIAVCYSEEINWGIYLFILILFLNH